MPKTNEAEIRNMMKMLNCSREEAIDIIQCDDDIDHGKRTKYDLDEKTEKEVLKDAHKGMIEKKPTAYNFTKRERKPNELKGSLIAEIADFLTKSSANAVESVEITNKEREIAFKVGEIAFSVTLIQHRPPKNA